MGIEQLIVHPISKFLGFLGFLMDVWYPWANWYMGGVRWDVNHAASGGLLVASQDSLPSSDPSSNAWKVALLLGAVIWTVSAAMAIKYLCTVDDSSDDDDTMVEMILFHLAIAETGSVLLIIDNALAGNLVFMLITLLIRSGHLYCILGYFREVRRARRETGHYRQFLLAKNFFLTRHNDETSAEDDDEDEDGINELLSYFRFRRNMAREIDSS